MLLKSIRKIWSAFRRGVVNFGLAPIKLIKALGHLFSYMKEQVKLMLPGWKEDAIDYGHEWQAKYSHTKEDLRKTRLVWKRAFSTVDASPAQLHRMLFEERTTVGKLFEEVLIVLITASVLVVMLDSISVLHSKAGLLFNTLEWIFTIIFTLEYLLRIYSSPHPIKYMTSFFGIIDLVTILPTYIGVIFTGAHTFLVLRILRVFRIFRLLKLVKMMKAGNTISASLKASKEKIAVFLLFVLLMVTIMGSMMYIIEADEDSGFTSIPISIYWAIVTLTTVGYGDIAPSTWFGQLVAAAIMITGYAVIAVPTGIVSAEFIKQKRKSRRSHALCDRCGKNNHERDSRYCNRCGEKLNETQTTPAVN